MMIIFTCVCQDVARKCLFLVGNNVRVMLIQRINEQMFLYQITKGTEKSFNLKLSTNLNTAFS